MSRPVDPRQKFLRWHIEAERARTDDLLAVRELRYRVQDAGHDPDAAGLTAERFFYDDRPDYRLYQPIPVVPVGEGNGRLTALYPAAELTDLLARLRQRPAGVPPGVLLRTRSGAGKTVAGRKAFWDCLHGAAPPLAGYLPCWLGPVVPGPEHFPVRAGPEAAVLGLLFRAATVNGTHAERLRPLGSRLAPLLQHGPPLLLFVDLNAFGTGERLAVAAGLTRYLALYPTHRCVVTHRSSRPEDETLHLLTGRPPEGDAPAFGVYDLEPIQPRQAELYLGNFRRNEQELLGKPGPAGATQEPIEAASRKAREDGECDTEDEEIKDQIELDCRKLR
jgi:hypothetical protein